ASAQTEFVPAAPTLTGLPVWRAERARDRVWWSPLVSAALALTAGIVADRYFNVPLLIGVIGIMAGLAAWLVTRHERRAGLALTYLAVAGVSFGAVYHRIRHDVYAANDIGNFASDEPQLARLRGFVEEEPVVAWQRKNDPLQSFERPEQTHCVLRVKQVKTQGEWLSVSGVVRLNVAGEWDSVHAGDE